MTEVVEMSHARVVRGELELLSDVSLTLRKGRCLAVVGETGAGKSLACRVLTGTLPRIGARLKSGTAVAMGFDLRRASGRELREFRRRHLGFVPQSSMASLNPVRTVGSQLVEAWRSVFASRPSERELLDALAHVELRDRTILTCYSHQLSGGMRQRVVIAMAILGRPHLLIADEPTTALDVTVQREIMQVISNLRREMGMSVILVTHDLATVEAEADDLTILYAGMTVESGPTSLVIDRPTHPYTMALLDSRLIHAVPGQRLKAIPGSPPTPQAWPPGCRFADRCSHAIEPCRLLVPEESAWGDAISRCHRTKEITGG